MKKSVFLLLAVLSCMGLQASRLKMSTQYSFVLYGANTSGPTPTSTYNLYFAKSSGMMPTFRLGLAMQYPVVRKFGLESGLLFDLQGWKYRESSSSLGAFRGNTLNLNLRLPLLAYYKLLMSSGGSFVFGGGINFDFLVLGSYKYKIVNQGLQNYQGMEDFSKNFNLFNPGAQFLLGLEDSEFSTFRVCYGFSFSNITTSTTNTVTPYYISIEFAKHIF